MCCMLFLVLWIVCVCVCVCVCMCVCVCWLWCVQEAVGFLDGVRRASACTVRHMYFHHAIFFHPSVLVS